MTIDTCYENLANAIVIVAAKDYRKVYKRSLNRNKSKQTEAELAELEAFFRSDWYKTLTSVNGEFLMERIRKECQK